MLQVYHITVIGYHYPTLILLGSLVGIALAAGVEVVVFGVIEYQMPCSEFVGHASGIERRAVALLIGMIAVAVGIETEGFAHEPVGAFGVAAAERMVGLVAEAHHHPTTRQRGTEAILGFLLGVDIETLHAYVAYIEAGTVAHFVHDHTLIHQTAVFGRERLTANHADDAQHLGMAVYMKPALIARRREHHAYHPDGAQDVVGVGMGDIHVMQVLDGYPRLLEALQYAVAAAGIDQQGGRVGLQDKAGVVAPGDGGVAGAEYDDSVHLYICLLIYNHIGRCLSYSLVILRFRRRLPLQPLRQGGAVLPCASGSP